MPASGHPVTHDLSWLLDRPVNPRIKSGEGDDNDENQVAIRRAHDTHTGATTMRMKHLMLSTAASLAVALMTSGLGPLAAQAAPALSGQVTGPEGPLEGVLVTAKKNGSTIAYTVVSDAKGHYGFPAGKIEGGEYTLRIRATGFDLDGAGKDGAIKANVDGQKPTTADLKLKKTKNLA